jgi:hypothetical protein
MNALLTGDARVGGSRRTSKEFLEQVFSVREKYIP